MISIDPKISTAGYMLILWRAAHGAFPDLAAPKNAEICEALYVAAGGDAGVTIWAPYIERAYAARGEPWFIERAVTVEALHRAARG
jgi:hypothetical protein